MVFLHPSSFIHSLALSPSLSLSFLPVLLRLHLGCVAERRSAEAMAAMVALSPGVLAPTSRNTLHLGPTFRSSKLLCIGQARSHHRVMSFFSSLSFLSFISLSLPSSSPLLHMRVIRAGVCLCLFFFFFLISFSVFREKGGKKKIPQILPELWPFCKQFLQWTMQTRKFVLGQNLTARSPLFL